jgi:hypothetical protein
MRCTGLPRRANSGSSGRLVSTPCVRRWTFPPPYFSYRILRYPGMSTETEFAIKSIRVATAPAIRYIRSKRTPASLSSTVSIKWCRVTCVKFPPTRARTGVMSPENATSGLRPKVLNSRLNHTTSGLHLRTAARSLTGVAGSSNDQHRWTENSGSSGWGEGSSSASIVRLRKGLR